MSLSGFKCVSELVGEGSLKSLVLLKHFGLYHRLKKKFFSKEEQFSTSSKPIMVAPVLKYFQSRSTCYNCGSSHILLLLGQVNLEVFIL